MDHQIMASFHNVHKYTAPSDHSDKRYIKQLVPSADPKNKFPRIPPPDDPSHIQLMPIVEDRKVCILQKMQKELFCFTDFAYKHKQAMLVRNACIRQHYIVFILPILPSLENITCIINC